MTLRTETTLDFAYQWEQQTPEQLWLTQPLPGGSTKTFTWRQAMDETRRMAAHLQSLGLPPGSRIALFSKNTAWWIMADLAIWMAGHVTVPLYPTLTPDIIQYVLEHSEAKLVFVGKLDDYETMAPGLGSTVPRVVMPLAPAAAAGTGARWEDLVAKTEPLKGEVQRSPDDLATVVYTSGSTGRPKGVMTTFKAILGAVKPLQPTYHVTPADRWISYLPLAHVFERWIVENGSLVSGAQIFFAESLETFVKDLQRARPTIFISVPRLWQKFQLGVFQKMPPEKLSMLLKIPIVKKLIGKKVLKGLGLDQVRLAGTGSAAISAELISWYRSLGLQLFEGWAMSENFACGTVNHPGANKVGTIGKPFPGVEIKIAENGEILNKSPGMMTGYYKDPAATAEAFEDGWLKTGDKGELDADGFLKITGRVKEIFKTSKGKYVAPAYVETRLLLHPSLEMACVMGDGQPQPHAVVMLSEAARKKAGDPSARAELVKSLTAHIATVNQALPAYEQLDFVAISPVEWTVQGGILTPTMKVRRGQMEKKYAPAQDGWYAKGEKVFWLEA